MYEELLPHEIKSGGVVQELSRVGEEVVAVGEQGEKTLFGSGGANNRRFTRDADIFGGVHKGDPEATLLVDEAEGQSLLAGQTSPVARGRILSSVEWRPVKTSWTFNWVYMLSTRDWEVGLFLGGEFAGGITGVL